MTRATLSDRNLRQRDIVPPEALERVRATVVGVGAIGRQVALQLAAVGVPWLQLIDPDTVETVNLAPQGYLQDDLQRLKVEATADLCRRMNPGIEVQTAAERFRRSRGTPGSAGDAATSTTSGGGASGGSGGVLFCCVDSIETRRFIWEATKNQARFFCDGRMSAEVLRVLVAADASSRAHYPTTLFSSAEAFQGACTAKATIFCGNIAAGLMVGQFTKWLRRLPIESDSTLNLLAAEWSVAAITQHH